jgi:polyhydroxyalkanoate synthesis regulator phasin
MEDKLIEKAKKAIEDVFSDTSVSQSKTIERLEELLDDIKTYIDSLQ